MRRHLYQRAQAKPPKPKRASKRNRMPEEVITMREPAPKMRLTREDCYRSPGGRGYDQR